jgi:hypothetical protein
LSNDCFHAGQTRDAFFISPAFTPRQQEENSHSPPHSVSPSLLENQQPQSPDIWSFDDELQSPDSPIPNEQVNVINQHINEVHDLIQADLQENQAPDSPRNYYGNVVDDSSHQYSEDTHHSEIQSSSFENVPSQQEIQELEHSSSSSSDDSIVIISNNNQQNTASSAILSSHDNNASHAELVRPLRETIQQQLQQLRHVISQHQEQGNSSSAANDSDDSIF